VWFLAHLIEAVRSVRPTLAEALRQALEERGEEAGRHVDTSLINEIHEGGTRIVVIIDDWHRITDAATIEALAYLLDHGDHHLQVVVTSRTRTGLPMGRMRVRDELVEIDGAALRFDLSESRAFSSTWVGWRWMRRMWPTSSRRPMAGSQRCNWRRCPCVTATTRPR